MVRVRRIVVCALVLCVACGTADVNTPTTTSPTARATRTSNPSPAINDQRSSVPASGPKQAPTVVPDRPRIAVLVLENKEYDDVVGNEKAPYFNKLARSSALATSFYAITHPSLPNYLAMLSGRRYDVGDCTDCHFDARTIVDQFEEKDISWKAYIEGFPGNCSSVPSKGRYAKKHNPFVYFDDIVSNPARCAKIVPTTQLTTDIKRDALPSFVWITPDMCNDSHDCSFEVADKYLARVVPGLVKALGDRGVLVVTFDEGRTKDGCCKLAAGGHIATIVTGPGARPGKYREQLDLYSLLRLIEDRWGLGRLGDAACTCTPSMAAMVR
jgi:phosphatidylinositol-3-phosphatase